MARGWESKSVESQQEERLTRKEARPEEKPGDSRRDALRLSKTRMERDLESSSNPRYREYLESALKDLDRQISELPRK